MPSKIKLGRDQVLTLDGVALEGVRELDLDVDAETQEITAPHHAWKSWLPIAYDVTVKVLIYWKDNYDNFADKLDEQPPSPLKLGVSNVGEVWVLPAKVSIKQPIQGVLAWEVELKPYWFE